MEEEEHMVVVLRKRSKVDRSAAYATRHIAKNLVASGITDECLVQVGYAIGLNQWVFISILSWSKLIFRQKSRKKFKKSLI